jgi:outer membrane protein OmpA-like peptidoglycan-associated protein
MSGNERDSDRKSGLGAILAATAVLVAGVIGYVVLHGSSKPAGEVASMSAASAVEVIADQVFDVAVTGEPLATVFFASGSAELTAESATGLDAVVAAVNSETGKLVLLSGYHDASGDPVQNAELAKQRAKVVRDALVSHGVAPERVLLRKPEVTDGGANAEAARRVDLSLIDHP